jgi:hypothetical protein
VDFWGGELLSLLLKYFHHPHSSFVTTNNGLSGLSQALRDGTFILTTYPPRRKAIYWNMTYWFSCGVVVVVASPPPPTSHPARIVPGGRRPPIMYSLLKLARMPSYEAGNNTSFTCTIPTQSKLLRLLLPRPVPFSLSPLFLWSVVGADHLVGSAKKLVWHASTAKCHP